MTTLTETWRAIPGYEGAYEVSDLGRVRSLDRHVPTRRHGGAPMRVHGRMKKQGTNRLGYRTVRIGQRSKALVHRLIALTFLGPPPPGTQVHHLDGCKHNNHASNLAWVTASENTKHAFETGLATPSRGESHYATRFTEEEVRTIRRLAGTVSQQELAKRYGVRQPTISKIVRRERWAHV